MSRGRKLHAAKMALHALMEIRYCIRSTLDTARTDRACVDTTRSVLASSSRDLTAAIALVVAIC